MFIEQSLRNDGIATAAVYQRALNEIEAQEVHSINRNRMMMSPPESVLFSHKMIRHDVRSDTRHSSDLCSAYGGAVNGDLFFCWVVRVSIMCDAIVGLNDEISVHFEKISNYRFDMQNTAMTYTHFRSFFGRIGRRSQTNDALNRKCALNLCELRTTTPAADVAVRLPKLISFKENFVKRSHFPFMHCAHLIKCNKNKTCVFSKSILRLKFSIY